MSSIRFMILGLCIGLFGLLTAVEPVVEPASPSDTELTLGPAGSYVVYRAELEGFPGASKTPLTLVMVNGVMTRINIAHPNVVIWDGHETLALQPDGSIQGTIKIFNDNGDIFVMFPLEIHLNNTGTILSGTWTLAASRYVPRYVDSGFAQDLVEEPVDISGVISGEMVAEASLAAANAVPADAVWDNYLGPNENFSASAAYQPELIEDLNQARIVWVSDVIGPVESTGRESQPRYNQPRPAGGATPVLAEGRIIQYHYRPAGDAFFQDGFNNFLSDRQANWPGLGVTREELARNFLLQADDLVTCLDAATGRLIWEVRFPLSAINLPWHKNGVNNLTPAYADGVVFVLGNRGFLRAIKVETGEVLWETTVVGYRKGTEPHVLRGLAAWETHDPSYARPTDLTRNFNTGVVAADGVVVVPSSVSGGGLVALSAETGAILWSKDWSLGNRSTPVIYQHPDGAMVIANRNTSAGGNVKAFDLHTGELLWQFDMANGYVNSDTICVLSGDRYLTMEGVYRIDRNGANRLFSYPNDGLVSCKAAATVWGDTALVRTGDNTITPTAHWIDLNTGAAFHSDTAAAPANDEAHSFALSGRFIMEPDSQHGSINWWQYSATPPIAQIGPIGETQFAPTTAYEVPIGYALADGRMWIRGKSALYCLDLRKPGGAGNEPPVVTLQTPVQQSVVAPGDNVALSAAASDDGAVVSVQFMVDNKVIGTDSDGSNGWSAHWTAQGSGQHIALAIARDDAGAVTASTGHLFTVSGVNQAPTVMVTTPAGSVTLPRRGITQTIVVTANDDNAVEQVIFNSNTGRIGIDSDGSDGWSYDWAVPGGSHSVTATAVDDQGLSATSAAVTIQAPVFGSGTLLWHETFDELAAGSTVDTGPTAWASNGKGAVAGQGFVSSDGSCTWTSEAIAINGGADFSFTLSSSDEVDSGGDTVVIYARIDGGPEVVLAEFDGMINFANPIPTPVHIADIVGDQLVIRIVSQTSRSNEWYRWDDLRVTARSNDGAAPISRLISLPNNEGMIWQVINSPGVSSSEVGNETQFSGVSTQNITLVATPAAAN